MKCDRPLKAGRALRALLTVKAARIVRKGYGVENMLSSIRVLLVLAIAIGGVGSVYGQSHAGHHSTTQVPRYTPQTPTTSPYLNLLNRNGSAATNYFGLVRPLLNQKSINEAQSQTASNQEQQIKNVKDQQEAFEQPKVKPTGTAGWFKTEGTTSPYQNASHYYGQWPSGKSQKKGSSGGHH